MPWFRVDDNLAFHAKVVTAGNAAMGLWVRAGSWASQQLSDGFVPEHIAGVLGTPQQVAKLVSSGLWHEAPGGFSFHKWDERQPKKEVIEEERAAARERMRKFRAQKKGTNSEEPLVSAESSEELPSTRSNLFGNPYPTRPDPTHITPTELSTTGARKRGTRLPTDFIPSEKARQAIIAETPTLDLRREHAKFVDHFTAAAGQRGVRVDWDATWRNWMREAADRASRNGHPSRQQEIDDLFARNAARMGVTPDQLALEGKTA